MVSYCLGVKHGQINERHVDYELTCKPALIKAGERP